MEQTAEKLSLDLQTLPPAGSVDVWVLEFNDESSYVWSAEKKPVIVSRHPLGLESTVSGGYYSDPQPNGQVELFTCEDSCMALFADEAAMKAGAAHLVASWGDEMSVGVANAFSAL